MIRFDWDENKNKSNRKKHGVWFEEAQSVFDDLNGRIFLDVRISDYEDRFILIGVNNFLKLLVVVHCQRESGTVIRLISARKATRKEREFYEEGI
ncbi:MAG: BrnT family toxin [Proteobacteria bacterium]|nr:MAG: BrnT family toxin [Pseudomonadota bacterium]